MKKPPKPEALIVNNWPLQHWENLKGKQQKQFKYGGRISSFKFPFKITFSFDKPEVQSSAFVTLNFNIEFLKNPPPKGHTFQFIFSEQLYQGDKSKLLYEEFYYCFEESKKVYNFDRSFSRFRYDSEIESYPHIELIYYPTKYLPYEKQQVSNINYKGIQNPSNLCYIIVIIQMLYHLPAFKKLIYSRKTRELYNDKSSILRALQNTFIALNKSETGSISINALLYALKFKNVNEIQQNDAHQFLIFLLGELSSNAEMDHEIHDLFGFKTKTDNTITEELAWSLRLQGETFEEAIDLDRKAFKVEGQLAEKKQTFISLPKVLILHFNLYNEQNPNRKQRLDFNFPEKLDLTKYVEGGDEIKYNLYASIMHNGFLNSGHYYIYLKPKLDGNYCLFNNENVSEQSNPSYFLNFANAKDTKEQKEYRDSSYPYILVYTRNDCETELGKSEDISVPDYLINPSQNEETKIQFTIRDRLSLASNINNGYIGFSPENNSYQTNIEASSSCTYSELYEIVKEKTQKSKFRLYVRTQDSIIGTLIEKTEDHQISELASQILFLDELDAVEPFELKQHEIRIFQVYFDPSTTHFEFLAMRTVNFQEQISSLIPSTKLLLTRNKQQNQEQNSHIIPNSFDIYIDNLTGLLSKCSPYRKFDGMKNGTILIFVPTNVKPAVISDVEPTSYSNLHRLPMYFEEDRQLTLENYYAQKHAIWEFKVFLFDYAEDYIIQVPFSIKNRKFIQFLIKITKFHYSQNDDEILIFPVEYQGYPESRPISLSSYGNLKENNLSSYTAFYLDIAHELKGQLFKKVSESTIATIRVTISEDGFHTSQIKQTTNEFGFSPNDIVESLNLQLKTPFRCREIITSTSHPVDLDKKLPKDKMYYHLHFEPDFKQIYEENGGKEEYHEIAVQTGYFNQNNNICIYGQSIMMQVFEGQTCQTLINRYKELAGIDDEEIEFVVVDKEMNYPPLYQPEQCGSMVEASKLGYSLIVIKDPIRFQRREVINEARF